MALSQSAVSELLEAFRTGDGVDLIRDSVRLVMQELIETEATERIGAARYERTEESTTGREGGSVGDDWSAHATVHSAYDANGALRADFVVIDSRCG